MRELSSKERLKVVLNHGMPDRIPMLDGFWPDTVSRWHKEGLPKGIDPVDYFEFDRIGIIYFDGSFQYEKEIIEETEEYIVEKDEYGATVKSWKNSYATPSHIDWPIKSKGDWLIAKERLKANKGRTKDTEKENYKKFRERDLFTVISPLEPFWFILEYALGFDVALSAMVENIGLINDIMATYTGFVINMCELCIEKGMKFDGLWFFSDLCFKNGMLFSPKVYKEIIMPHHKRIAEFCNANKWPLILHCDGDVREFIPLIIESGFKCIQPLEARCGNDVRELKRLYGTNIVFFGNISADIMTRDKKVIEKEVRTKIQIAKEGGGYIYHSDHSIPPTVSLENYQYAIELVKSYGRY